MELNLIQIQSLLPQPFCGPNSRRAEVMSWAALHGLMLKHDSHLCLKDSIVILLLGGVGVWLTHWLSPPACPQICRWNFHVGILTPSHPPLQQGGKGTESPNLGWSFAVWNTAYSWGSLSPHFPYPSSYYPSPQWHFKCRGSFKFNSTSMAWVILWINMSV